MSWIPKVSGLVPVLCFLFALAACGGNADGQATGPAAADADGSIWVLSRADRSITIIDARQAAAVGRINLGFASDPGVMVYRDGTVWVGSSGGLVQRVDASTRTLIDSVELPMDVWWLSAAAHGVYAMDAELGLVTRHDLRTGEVLATYDPPDRIHAMAAGPETVAVHTGDRREVHFYAPGATESRVVTAEIGGGDMVLGFGSFWIYHPDGRLLRVDPDSAAIAAEIDMDADLYFPAIAISDDAVWLTLVDTDELIRVDPAANQIVARIPVRGSPEAVAVHGDAAWVALPQDDTVVRIDAESGAETARVSVEWPVRVVAVP